MKKIIRRDNGTIRVQTINNLPSKTQPQFQDSTNINIIMKKYHAGHGISHINSRKGFYDPDGKLSAINYQQSLQTVIDAQNSFNSLPSEVRKMFQNDPYQLITFLSDPKNKDKAMELGLLNIIPSEPTNPTNDLNERSNEPVTKKKTKEPTPQNDD